MPRRDFSQDALQAYLASKDVVVLATLAPDGAPLAMPMWFVHDAEQIAMVSVDRLAKIRNLERDPRVCVVAEGGGRGKVDGVVLTGTVEFLGEPERSGWGRRFAEKYAPHAERLWGGTSVPANRRVFALRPRVASAWGL